MEVQIPAGYHTLMDHRAQEFAELFFRQTADVNDQRLNVLRLELLAEGRHFAFAVGDHRGNVRIGNFLDFVRFEIFGF
jgi:hypothetical protein